MGVGVAGLAAGIGLGVAAGSKADEVEQAAKDEGQSWRDIKQDVDAGEQLEIGAIVGYSVGGAALATGAVLLIMDLTSGTPTERRAHVAPALVPGGAMVTGGVAF